MKAISFFSFVSTHNMMESKNSNEDLRKILLFNLFKISVMYQRYGVISIPPPTLTIRRRKRRNRNMNNMYMRERFN